MKKYMLALAVAAMAPSVAHAAAFTNGSFELGTAPGSFSTQSVGSSAILGWNIAAGSIDYIGNYWTAGQGSRSIDLSGNAPGTIAQTFDTVIGKTYLVDFMMAGNPDGGSAAKVLKVSATGNALETFSFNTNGKTKSAMGWASKSYQFTATSGSTTLSFAGVGNGAYGAALDNIALTAAVPEPASWAMMIGGFALAGGAMRRKPSKASLAFA